MQSSTTALLTASPASCTRMRATLQRSVAISVVLVSCGAAEVPTAPGTYELRQRLEWCGQRPGQAEDFLPGLDDVDCIKVFPKLFDREFACPCAHSPHPGFGAPAVSVSEAAVDEDALQGVVDPASGARVAVALLHRETNGQRSKASGHSVGVKYLGFNAGLPYQPWSSTKPFAAFDAAARIRSLSKGGVGLQAYDAQTGLALGDLVTIISSYDLTQGLTSNELGAYFHSIGRHEVGLKAAHSWLGANASSGASFGGDYGEAVPRELGYTFVSKGEGPSQRIHVPADHPPSPPLPNNLDALTLAEWMRRVVLTREDSQSDVEFAPFPEDETRPTWQDAQQLLYGARPSDTVFKMSTNASLQWGGMSMSTDVYLQQAIDASIGMNTMALAANDSWRIFSKLGAGHSSSRQVTEITLNAYACLPVIDQTTGQPQIDKGLEFTVSLFVPLPDPEEGANDSLRQVDSLVTQLMTNVSRYLVDNYYSGSKSPLEAQPQQEQRHVFV